MRKEVLSVLFRSYAEFIKFLICKAFVILYEAYFNRPFLFSEIECRVFIFIGAAGSFDTAFFYLRVYENGIIDKSFIFLMPRVLLMSLS